MTKKRLTRYGHLKPRQRKLLECALEGGINRTMTAIAEQASIPRTTLYRWMRQDSSFRQAWETLVDESVFRHLPSVAAAMASKAAGGDVSAARLMTDLSGRTGRHVTGIQVNNSFDFESPAATTEIARRAYWALELERRGLGPEVPDSVREMVAESEAAAAASSAPRQLEHRPEPERRRAWPDNLPPAEKVPGNIIEAEPAPQREPLDKRLVPLGSDYGEHGLPRLVNPRVIRKGDKR